MRLKQSYQIKILSIIAKSKGHIIVWGGGITVGRYSTSILQRTTERDAIDIFT